MKKILILNGPNLNLLGTREPEVYGNLSIADWLKLASERFSDVELIHHQSNVEGELINILHQYGFEVDGIVFNPGAYTHTSIALADAIKAIPAPVVEVHISNVHQREEFRRHSFISPVAKGVIGGLGLRGYDLAVEYLKGL